MQAAISEHLMPSAGNRLIRRCDYTLQHITCRCTPWDLHGTCHIKAARSIMQQRRVGRPQCHRYRGITFMTGRPDRVEALAALLQLSCGEVELPALRLGVE